MPKERIDRLYFVTASENKFNDYQFLLGKLANLIWYRYNVEDVVTTDIDILLRRKVAVRIRAGLRASDVVASLGSDSFAVLLAWIDAPDDAPHVAAKLAQQVRQPYNVAGSDRAVAVALGLAAYPENGRDADALLRRATSQAASVATVGREGFANRIERGSAAAANDD